MGFLDFLKKDNLAAPAPTSSSLAFDQALRGEPAPPQRPEPFHDIAPKPLDASALFASTPATAFSAPTPVSSFSAPPPVSSFSAPKTDMKMDWSKEETVPLPPVALQDKNYLAPVAAITPVAASPMAAPAIAPAAPVSRPARRTTSEIPDFSEEDLASLDQMAKRSLPELPEIPKSDFKVESFLDKKPEAPVKKEPEPKPELKSVIDFTENPFEKPTVKLVAETPVVAAPANAVGLPADDVRMLGEDVSIAMLEPAKFLSAQSYLSIISDIKTMRRTMRQGDEVIKEATLRHEQLDQQYKRAAADANAVQDCLISIDAALFEE